MTFSELLGVMVKRQASELFIIAGAPPSLKINGAVKQLSKKPLNDKTAMDLVLSAMNDEQRQEYQREWECSFVVRLPTPGRFRVNVCRQNGQPSMVVRRIPARIPSLEELNLPPVLRTLIGEGQGLVLLVSCSSEHKAAALASLVDYRNQTCSGHIITIEDPIEYVHVHKKSIVAQREVGTDALSLEQALSSVLRHAPDVIVMGELRNGEVVEHAIRFAESGRLCLATLHASSVSQALERILSCFPPAEHARILMDLSFSLRGIVSQMPLSGADIRKPCLAVEVMLNTPLIGEMIRKGEMHKIRDVMKAATDSDMQTFDQSLFGLYQQGRISYETVLKHAESASDIRLMTSLADTSTSHDEGPAPRALRIGHDQVKEQEKSTLAGFTFLPDTPVESAPLVQDSKKQPYILKPFTILPDKSEDGVE